MRAALHDFGERWDPSDVEALRIRRQNGETRRHIAGAMGRSTAGVASKLARLRRGARPAPKGK